MSQEEKPAAERPEDEAPRENANERERRFVGREVGPEDEERKSPGGPQAQVTPDIEPSGT
jgi:hypothetical protein